MAESLESVEQYTYEINVKGELDGRWSDWFDSVVVAYAGGVTTLTCVVDQAALHGILDKIRDLNLVLISVNLVDV